MESAKQLSTLIDEFRNNALNGGFNDPPGFNEFIRNETLNDPDAPIIAKFVCGLGDDGGTKMAAVARVWGFRDRLNDYQRRHNISSIYWRELTWKGEKIRFPATDTDLEFMPQDGAILARWKDRIINRFVSFICCQNIDHLLCRVDYDGEGETETPVSLTEIYTRAKDFDFVSLSGGTEHPVYLAKQTETGNLLATQEICYHLTEFDLWFENIPTKADPDPESLNFTVKLRRL